MRKIFGFKSIFFDLKPFLYFFALDYEYYFPCSSKKLIADSCFRAYIYVCLSICNGHLVRFKSLNFTSYTFKYHYIKTNIVLFEIIVVKKMF